MRRNIDALDLFSGIGGFAIACERVGIRTVAFCETDPFCRAVLGKHWPDVPIYPDVRDLDATRFRGVDLVVGGFPCQDVSAAGKGAGIGGTRSGLWVEMARIIAGCRPRWVLVENVPALRTRGADRVLADLEALGYDAWPLVVGAWAVGAPHKRDRVWIVGRDEGLAYADPRSRSTEPERERHGRDEPSRASAARLADAAESRRPTGIRGPNRRTPAFSGESGGRGSRWPARPGEEQHEWEEPRLVAYAAIGGLGVLRRGREAARDAPFERPDNAARPAQLPMGRAVDGLPARLVRTARRNNREALKAYGNAIVPEVAEAILTAILKGEVQ